MLETEKNVCKSLAHHSLLVGSGLEKAITKGWRVLIYGSHGHFRVTTEDCRLVTLHCYTPLSIRQKDTRDPTMDCRTTELAGKTLLVMVLLNISKAYVAKMLDSPRTHPMLVTLSNTHLHQVPVG